MRAMNLLLAFAVANPDVVTGLLLKKDKDSDKKKKKSSSSGGSDSSKTDTTTVVGHDFKCSATEAGCKGNTFFNKDKDGCDKVKEADKSTQCNEKCCEKKTSCRAWASHSSHAADTEGASTAATTYSEALGATSEENAWCAVGEFLIASSDGCSATTSDSFAFGDLNTCLAKDHCCVPKTGSDTDPGAAEATCTAYKPGTNELKTDDEAAFTPGPIVAGCVSCKVCKMEKLKTVAEQKAYLDKCCKTKST